jgi:hypothetical protein
MQIFLLLFFLIPTFAYAQCADDNSLSLFYKEFREAVHKDDVKKIVQITQFPFKTRQVLSSEAPMLVSKSKFIRYYKYMMKLPVKGNPSDKGTTQREMVWSTKYLQRGGNFNCRGAGGREILYDTANVGLFDFARGKDGQWRFVGAMIGELYLNIEEDSEPLD